MSSREHPIFTIKNNCQDCYKCVRECPVKAIKIEDNSAQIVPDLCVACGKCYKICPVRAKQDRDDVTRAKNLIAKGEKVYVSLAPSWVAEFDNVSKEQLLTAIEKLGFAGVSETALGAEEVSAHLADFLSDKKDGIYLSTACPSFVEYVNKYLPDLSVNLTPVMSPLLAHCKIMRKEFGEDIKIVFVGPCIAKKFEADKNSSLLNLSISFRDLRRWLREKGINYHNIEPRKGVDFVYKHASKGRYYPIEGGMIETIKQYGKTDNVYMMQLTGLNNIKRELCTIKESLPDIPVFIECLACEGGCVSGPCTKINKSGFEKRTRVLKDVALENNANLTNKSHDIFKNYDKNPVVKKNYDEEQIKKVLELLGKHTIDDEINCNGCGYDNCRNFARAVLEGKAEIDMCVSHIKHIAQRKANALLKCIPSPIVIVNSKLSIIEYNEQFVQAFWRDEDHADIYDRNSLIGANLRDFISFTNLFSASLDLGEDVKRENIKHNNSVYDVMVFNIEQKQVVGGVIADVTKVEIKREKIAEKAKEVIEKNLATVQQIACTLGEHMAETEVLLRSIAKDYSSEINDRPNITIRNKKGKF
ncbi:MAG: 4Fe-4S binding protein [Alphaproteobacteria bacterium]|nr:4Fe-4S binding protein [Alphaproteobacteria bacterium]